MKNIIGFIYCLLLIISSSLQGKAQPKSLTQLVNPFIGTGGHGHTFPGTTFPFGACQLSPDTRLQGWDGCGGYHFSDSVIYGFSHTHLSGTGCSDYGDILLMPVTKEMALDNYQYASPYSHKTEKANPGYYEVFLEAPKVKVELTSVLHGGIHKYTFPVKSEKYVVLDLKHRDEVLDSKMEKVDEYTLRGYRFSKAWAQNQKVFFEIKFNKPIAEIRYDAPKKGSNTTAIALEKSLHALIKFAAVPQDENIPFMVKVSISGVDEEGAANNLKTEMPDWNFEKYKSNADIAWENQLAKIKFDIDESTKGIQEAEKFYTSLYHCMIHPSLYSDVDGRYRGRDDKIHNTEGKFDYYTVFSLWDTYRGLHPLLNIIDKKRTNDFIQTFIKEYEEGGRLPVWELSSNETNCMIGYHVVSVIWDAYNRGIRDYNAEKAYEAMKSIATSADDYIDDINFPDDDFDPESGMVQTASHHTPASENVVRTLRLKDEARKRCADADALESYNRYAYVRSDDSHESVSKTLEYAYNDWCIAQMAAALGKTEDYKYYIKRSRNWVNVFDPTTGFMRARKNSSLLEPFSPYMVDNNFTEANSWQYSFYVPHEIDRLIEMQGGKDSFEYKLDRLFSAKVETEGREQADITGLIGQYAHGNEPSHAIAYLYNYIGKPEKTQAIIDKILDSFYTTQPDGLIGNEDCGQMSAWYVLNAMGLYSSCPGKTAYDFIKPRLKNIRINNEPVQGKSIERLKNQTSDIAPINIEAPHVTANPVLIHTQKIFENTIQPKLLAIKDVDPLYSYQMKFSIDNGAWQSADSLDKLVMDKSFSIKYYASTITHGSVSSCSAEKGCGYELFENIVSSSPIQSAYFTKLPADRKIILKNKFNPSYHAGGASGLIDGIFGKLNWRAGDWQGYQGQDIEVIMAFDEKRSIQNVSANFLEDQNSWIFYPKEVMFYSSDDSLQWKLIKKIPTLKSNHNLETSISKFTANTEKLQAKFIKLKAVNFGPMPQWHEGRGFPTFIFIDELEVN